MVSLYPYQRAWLEDTSRFRLWVKARDVGATFAAALSQVERRLARRGLTVWISASERQSREAIESVKLHAQALKEAFAYEEIDFAGTEEKAHQVTFKHNRARLLALPANPDTVRGFKGDVVLDEFAFHRDAVKIWRAALGIMSRGFGLDVISTPNGRQGKFWDLARTGGVDPGGSMAKTRWPSGQWSVHWIDIATAVEQGCPIQVEVVRDAAGDEDTWLQEYCCVFLADAENYIPLELILTCETESATLELPPDFLTQGPARRSPALRDAGGPLYLGMDIGRKKDRTVLWLWEKLGDVCWTRAVKVLERTPFRAQQEALESLLPLVTRAALDATGIGAMLAEEARRRHGPKVEPVEFNLTNKEEMATLTKRRFEERTVRIPPAPFLRRAFNAVKRYTSPTGHFRFDAERTDQGHADEFWAAALGLAAATGPAVSTEIQLPERVPVAYHLGGASGIARTVRAAW